MCWPVSDLTVTDGILDLAAALGGLVAIVKLSDGHNGCYRLTIISGLYHRSHKTSNIMDLRNPLREHLLL